MCILFIVSENPIQILCGHYQYLIENMDSKEFGRIAFFKSLLSINELDVLLHCSIDYIKNTYVFEHIRSLETPELFQFINALQEISSQQRICDTLLNGKSVVSVLKLSCFINDLIMSFCRVDLSSNGFNFMPKSSDDDIGTKELSDSVKIEGSRYDEKQLESYKILLHKRKQPLLPNTDAAEVFIYFLPSDVVLKYLDLFDNVVELLQSLHPHKVTEVLSSIKASDKYNYFTDDCIERMRKCTSISSIMKVVFPYTNWYDHSILRELVGACHGLEGVKLLDEFDTRIDNTLPITSYPISAPSNLIVPDKSSSHTVMAVRYNQQLSSLSLQHIGAVKSLMVGMCDVTKHALLLVAVANHSSAMFFWLIPRRIVSIMTRAVIKHSTFVYEAGLLEVAIYPNFSFSFGSTSRIWKMAYFRDTAAMLQHVRMHK